MTLKDDVASAIEKTLLTSPASYPYLETITKTFLASTGLQKLETGRFFLAGSLFDVFPFVLTQMKIS